jgi:hypothetical protein
MVRDGPDFVMFCRYFSHDGFGPGAFGHFEDCFGNYERTVKKGLYYRVGWNR